MRVMARTREVEVDKEEIDNLGRLDQTRHANSTLGECETLLARSFISPGPLCPTLSQSQPASVFGIIRHQLGLHLLTYQVPWRILIALQALPGPTILHGETDPQSFSPSCSPGQPKAGREL